MNKFLKRPPFLGMHAILNSEHLKINKFDLKCEIRTFMITWVKSIDFSKIYKGKYFQTLNAFF